VRDDPRSRTVAADQDDFLVLRPAGYADGSGGSTGESCSSSERSIGLARLSRESSSTAPGAGSQRPAPTHNGLWLVTAGPGSAGLWDLVNQQRLLFLDGHQGLLLAAGFDRSGRRITTIGADGTVRTYSCDVCGGTAELLRLAARRLQATGRSLTPDERLRYLGR
jgi:WD40 repeat protein